MSVASKPRSSPGGETTCCCQHHRKLDPVPMHWTCLVQKVAFKPTIIKVSPVYKLSPALLRHRSCRHAHTRCNLLLHRIGSPDSHPRPHSTPSQLRGVCRMRPKSQGKTFPRMRISRTRGSGQGMDGVCRFKADAKPWPGAARSSPLRKKSTHKKP